MSPLSPKVLALVPERSALDGPYAVRPQAAERRSPYSRGSLKREATSRGAGLMPGPRLNRGTLFQGLWPRESGGCSLEIALPAWIRASPGSRPDGRAPQVSLSQVRRSSKTACSCAPEFADPAGVVKDEKLGQALGQEERSTSRVWTDSAFSSLRGIRLPPPHLAGTR